MYLPSIATTTSPLRISMQPLEMKYRSVIRSPAWTKVSPGGAWVVWNLVARALKQPLVDPRQHDKHTRSPCWTIIWTFFFSIQMIISSLKNIKKWTSLNLEVLGLKLKIRTEIYILSYPYLYSWEGVVRAIMLCLLVYGNCDWLPLKAVQFCRRDLLRWRQISPWRHSGKLFNTFTLTEKQHSFVRLLNYFNHELDEQT